VVSGEVKRSPLFVKNTTRTRRFANWLTEEGGRATDQYTLFSKRLGSKKKSVALLDS